MIEDLDILYGLVKTLDTLYEKADNTHLIMSERIEKIIGHWMLAEACDDIFEWRKWSQEIPYIQFPAHWKVKLLPPWACAIVRFMVKSESNVGKEYVSVYA